MAPIRAITITIARAKSDRLLADVHANIDALETVLATLAARGIEQIYCAGDLVGYNAAPNACCERLRHLKGVRGNHDGAALLEPGDPELR